MAKSRTAKLVSESIDGLWYLSSPDIPGLHLAYKTKSREYIDLAVKRLERSNNGLDVEVDWKDDTTLELSW